MRKAMRWAVPATLAVALLVPGPGASAKAGDVVKTGNCSVASTWKLKLSPQDGQIEVQFEVDQNVVGDTWRVVLKQNGEVFFTGKRVTKAPSGSFEVRKLAPDTAGTDSFVGRARNLTTDERCRGTASI